MDRHGPKQVGRSLFFQFFFCCCRCRCRYPCRCSLFVVRCSLFVVRCSLLLLLLLLTQILSEHIAGGSVLALSDLQV